MYKYKYFLLFFCGIAVLLLWLYFPISFDNNDDQVIFAISSGFLTGIPSPNLILTNLLIGKLLNQAFILTPKINWYTLYLQVAQLFSFLTFCYFFIVNKKFKLLESILIILIIFLGFFSLCIVKLQFTTVSLFCCFTALFIMQSELHNKIKFGWSLFFITLSILIRKDVFYIFILFSVAILYINRKDKIFLKTYFLTMLFSVLIFSVFFFINNNNKNYKELQTNKNIELIDIIAAKPTKITDEILQNNNFSKDDILLMRSWFFADDNYSVINKIEQLAKSIKTYRSIEEIKFELIKFVQDERYIIAFYTLSILLLLFFLRRLYSIWLINLLLFLVLFVYLIITSRIPHRLTFPILTYLILVNIFYFLKNENRLLIRYSVLFLFFFISTYKFYCTSKLVKINNENHKIFNGCNNEINKHPNNLFIALDGFPLQNMNAWQTPDNLFKNKNIILTGWYVCTPDYQVLMKNHKLKNLTSDLISHKNILFLTNSETVQNSYIKVMKQRYNIDCHFEDVQNGFLYLHPKNLVIEN